MFISKRMHLYKTHNFSEREQSPFWAKISSTEDQVFLQFSAFWTFFQIGNHTDRNLYIVAEQCELLPQFLFCLTPSAPCFFKDKESIWNWKREKLALLIWEQDLKPQTNKLRNPSKGTFGAPSGTVPSLESEKRDNATEGDLWRPNPGQIFGL